MFETGKSLSAISKFDSVLEKNQPIYKPQTFCQFYDFTWKIFGMSVYVNLEPDQSGQIYEIEPS